MVSLNELIQRYRIEVSQTLSQRSVQISGQILAQTSGQMPSQASSATQYYQCQQNVNLYDSPQLQSLATQAATDRQLRILPLPLDADGQLQSDVSDYSAIPVCLYEDDYPGWLALDDVAALEPIDGPHTVPIWTAAEIRDRIPEIITYMTTAMAQPNEYLWGGVIGPNYDCSGLMQAAFRSQGIWLPRDAYQQEAFIQSIELDALEVGDLIFFGPKERANHVALYLGNALQDGTVEHRYIHSSGKSIGRNGIGIDILPLAFFSDLPSPPSSSLDSWDNTPEKADAISQAYAELVHGVGRVVTSYHPQGTPIKPLDAKVIPMT